MSEKIVTNTYEGYDQLLLPGDVLLTFDPNSPSDIKAVVWTIKKYAKDNDEILMKLVVA